MEPTPRHMPLQDWDEKVALFLGAVKSRAGWLIRDSQRIKELVKDMEAVPIFETEAMARMVEAKESLEEALSAIGDAINLYNQKEKVT